MAARPSFPLPRGYFNTRLPAEQDAHFRHVAQTQLDAVLRAERDFVLTQSGLVNTRKWRLARKEHKLRVFRRRTNSVGLADAHHLSSLLAVGQVDERIDVLLHGLRSASQDEFQAMIAYMDANNRDAALLHTLERESPADPTRYLGIKWTLARLPSTILAKPRDWCFLEALGVSVDSDGQRFGYIVLHSVSPSSCPPFEERAAVRATGEFAFVLREREPGVTDVFATGLFDPAGDLPSAVSVALTADIFLRLAKTSQCVEAKRLTMLAVRNYTAAAQDDDGVIIVQPTCSICTKAGGMFATLRMCNVCGATACAKCRVKKRVFTGVGSSLCEILSCKTCILEAKRLSVHTFLVQEPHQSLPRETIWRGTTEWSTHSHSEEEEETTMTDDDATSLDYGSDRGERTALTRSQRSQRRVATAPPHTLSQSVMYDKLDAASSPNSPGSRETLLTGSPSLSPQDDLYARMRALQSAAHHAYAITKANEEWMRKL